MGTTKNLITNIFKGNGRFRTCELCGNEYDKCFEVRMDGETHVFDSFECAIHALAPKCAHCGCQIIGHGMEVNGVFFCCAHCASEHGGHVLTDRIEVERSPA
jgi:Rieske Fe-S protein